MHFCPMILGIFGWFLHFLGGSAYKKTKIFGASRWGKNKNFRRGAPEKKIGGRPNMYRWGGPPPLVTGGGSPPPLLPTRQGLARTERRRNDTPRRVFISHTFLFAFVAYLRWPQGKKGLGGCQPSRQKIHPGMGAVVPTNRIHKRLLGSPSFSGPRKTCKMTENHRQR